MGLPRLVQGVVSTGKVYYKRGYPVQLPISCSLLYINTNIPTSKPNQDRTELCSKKGYQECNFHANHLKFIKGNYFLIELDLHKHFQGLRSMSIDQSCTFSLYFFCAFSAAHFNIARNLTLCNSWQRTLEVHSETFCGLFILIRSSPSNLFLAHQK